MSAENRKIDAINVLTNDLAEIQDAADPREFVESSTLNLLSSIHYFYLTESSAFSFDDLLANKGACARNAFVASVGLRMAPLWADLMDGLELDDTVENLLFYLNTEVLIRLFCNRELGVRRRRSGTLVANPVDDSLLIVGADMAMLLQQHGINLTLPAKHQNPAVVMDLDKLLDDVRTVVKHREQKRLEQETRAQILKIQENPFSHLENYTGYMH